MTLPRAHNAGTRPRRGPTAGFTLLEVLAALAILGTALFVLLDAHFSSLSLHDRVREEVTARQLMDYAIAQAEVELLQGRLAGDFEFGNRYPDYYWNYEAILEQADTMVQLFDVIVTVSGPDGSETLDFYSYDTGLGNDIDGNVDMASRQRNTGGPGGGMGRGGMRAGMQQGPYGNLPGGRGGVGARGSTAQSGGRSPRFSGGRGSSASGINDQRTGANFRRGVFARPSGPVRRPSRASGRGFTFGGRN